MEYRQSIIRQSSLPNSQQALKTRLQTLDESYHRSGQAQCPTGNDDLLSILCADPHALTHRYLPPSPQRAIPVPLYSVYNLTRDGTPVSHSVSQTEALAV